MRQRVLVIGGGYAGVTLARALDDTFDVVLLERRDRFFHNVGALRAYASPELYEQLLIPYGRLLRRGRVVQDEAIAVSAGGVRGAVDNYEADIVIVASGSRHIMPFKSPYTDSEQFLAEARSLSARLVDAQSVAVLGDGPVAVELAGEIRARYPNKPLTLVAAADRLLPSVGNPRLGECVQKILVERGVSIEFGRRQASADLVIPAYGASYAVPCLGATDRVPVDAQFQVPGLPGVYAIGDAANCGEPPLTFLARRQALHLARQLTGKSAAYQPAKRVAMSVPLGPEYGATQLPLPGLPIAGSWITRRLKGKRLFIAENWERMGMPRP